ncbi:hypothetical protein T484DRAFT_1896835 [Baffinella frigidus]|nr:hypothetical protein T484DRAFT_1896835 [Cryptophyta sp. CCMP2293]
MQAIDQSQRPRRPSSAGSRRESGHSGFRPLLKPFLWVGTMFPSIAWRKTKPPKAAAEEEPSSDPVATFDTFSRGKLDAQTRTRSLPVMLNKGMSSAHRSHSDPAGRDIVTHARAALGVARDGAHARSPEGAGARLLDRVLQLRAREAAVNRAKKIASPKLHYGMTVKKAEPVEGFAWTFARPEHMLEGEGRGEDHV